MAVDCFPLSILPICLCLFSDKLVTFACLFILLKFINQINMKTMKSNHSGHKTKAVSYTHLDVYKRQSLHRQGSDGLRMCEQLGCMAVATISVALW